MTRRLRLVLMTLAVIVGLITAAFLYAIHSPRVASWAVHQVPAWTGMEIEVGEVEGTLRGPLRLYDVRLDDDAVGVSLPELTLRWQPAALWLSQLRLNAVTMHGLRVDLRTTEAAGDDPAGAWPPPDIHLPFGIRLDRLDLFDARLTRDGDTLLQIDRARLAASMRGSQLNVDELRMDTPDVDVQASASARLSGDWPLALDARWRIYALPGAPLRTTTRVRGDLQALRLRQRLVGPGDAELRVRLTDLVDAPQWWAELTVSDWALPSPAPGLEHMLLSLDVNGAGDVASARVHGGGALSAEDAPPLDFEFAAQADAQRLILESLRVTPSGTRGYLEGEGVLDMAATPEPEVDLQLSWQDLRWPGFAPWAARDGELTLTGTAASHVTQMQGRFDVADVYRQAVPVSLRFDGTGDRHSWTLADLRLTLPTGQISAAGAVSWEEQLHWHVRSSGEAIDPSAFHPRWPGNVQFRIAAEGDPAGQAVRLERLGGELRGRSLSGSGEAARSDDGWRVDSVRLAVGDAYLSASGEVLDTLSLRAELRVPDIAWFDPRAGGSLRASVQADGQRSAPRLRVRTDAADLAWRTYYVGTLDVAADIDASDRTASRLRLDAAEVLALGRRIDRLALAGDGRVADHELSLNVAMGDALMRLGIDGSVDADAGQWQGQAQRFSLIADGDGWHQQDPPTPVTVDRHGGFSLATLCTGDADAGICLSGHRDGQDWSVELELRALPLAGLQPLLGPELVAEGQVSGHIRGGMDDAGRVRADAELQSSGGRLRSVIPDTDLDPVELVRYRDANLRLLAGAAGPGGLQASLETGVDSAGRLRLMLQAPDWDGRIDGLTTTPLDARLRANTRELELLSLLVPDIDRVSGVLDVDLGLSGTFHRPVLSGGATLVDGEMELARSGVHLREIAVQVVADAEDRLALQASAQSGGGTLETRGHFGLRQGRPELALRVDGENFQVADTSEARVWISPALDLNVEGDMITLNGTLDVPRAHLRPRDLTTTVRVSDDLVMHTAHGNEEDVGEGWQTAGRVRVTLGDAVAFDGYGLQGRLAGELVVVERPGEVTTGSGELAVVDGVYQAYGQRLNIEAGRLLFTGGPLVDPGVDVRAARQIREVRVGLNVRGTLQEPELTLFSEPPMSQSEALSWLILGRSLEQTSEEDGAVLAGAATAIGLAGGERLAQSIAGRFGIDDVTVEAEGAPEEAQLVLGTYLSPRMYISYGIGVFEPVNTARMRYRLTRNWTFRTESSALSSSADFVFSIDRDE